MAAKFEISKRSNGEYQFELKAVNGQTVLTSEGYAARASCDNGISSVRRNSQDDHRYQRKTSSNGKQYFNLTATNGQTIGTSQMYADAAGRDNGIASVKANAPGAEVVDTTAA